MNSFSKVQSSSIFEQAANSTIAAQSSLNTIEQGQPQTFARSSSNSNELSPSESALQANNNAVSSGNGLYGEYYDNQNFTNLKLSRIDQTVDFDWGRSSPDSSMGIDSFSVRWTGKVEAKYNETYTFHTTSDDGVRLWVNGQQIINKFVNQSSTEWSGAIALQAGQRYDIRLDYFEYNVNALTKLSWSSASQTKQIIPQSQLFSDLTPPSATTNAPNLTTSGGNSYTFTVTYNDNTAVNVATLGNQDLIVSGPNSFSQLATFVSVDNNSNGSQRTATYRINLAGGEGWNANNNGIYAIALQANQVRDTRGNFANAGSIGSFRVDIAGTGTGLKGDYYDNQNFTNLKLSRIDQTVDFDWGRSSPDSSMGIDSFSVRWTGKVEAKYNETYTFHTTSDDGVRLWVNGQQIINKFVNQSSTEWSGAIALQAGQRYDIRLDYFEYNVNALAKLSWSSASQTKQIIPQSQLYAPVFQPIITLGTSVTTVRESAGNVIINLLRGGSDLSGTSSVKYATRSSSAVPGVDYGTDVETEVTGTITFAPGETSKQLAIPILNDSTIESTETFDFAIDQPVGATAGVQRTLTVTIQDDDSLDLNISQPVVNENVGTATVTVIRGKSSAEASVDYQTSDDTAINGSDYTAVLGTLNFAVGETSKTISIAIKDDTIGEANEQFLLRFSNAVGVQLTTPETTITIIDNDPGQFVKKDVVTGLTQPTAFDWTADGTRMFIAQQDGVVKLVDNGTLLATPFIDISGQVNNVRDRGLLGIAVHPDFGKATNPQNYVYLLFTYDPPETNPNNPKNNPNSTLDDADQRGNRAARLIRVEADPNTNYTTAKAGSEVVLLGQNSTWENINRPDGNSTDVTLNYAPSGIVNQNGNFYANIQDYLNNVSTSNITNVEDFIATDSESHSIGTVRFGSDGNLFVSTGDGTSYNRVDPRAIRSLDIDNLSGKILRIDPITGEGLADNPHYNGDADSNRSKVWNSGLRNPFRFTVDQRTNTPYIGDVGWNTWEELNTGKKGANFGWPFFEGGLNASGDIVSLKQPSYSTNTAIKSIANTFYNSGQPVNSPTYTYKHYASNSIIVGDFYTGNTFPSVYQNTLFVADASQGIIDNLTLDSEGRVISVRRFASSVGAPVQLRTGKDGSVYYVDLYTGAIRKFEPV